MNHSEAKTPSTWSFRSTVAHAALLICLLLAPAASHADSLDKILDFLVTAGVVDGAVKDAKLLIQCLISHNGDVTACVDVKSAAEQQGKQAKFMPTDPAIQATVQIIQAANAGDWVKVLELTGTDLLFRIACKAGLSTTGPVQNFVCSDTFNKISGLAKTEVGQVLILVGDPTVGHLLALIEMNVSPDLACKIAPDFPGKGEICGSLGELVKLGKDIANYASKFGKDLWYGAGDAFGLNDPPAMSQEAYYALAWAPLYHKTTYYCLANHCKGPSKGGQDGGGIHDIEYNLWHACKDYFASHDMTSSTAQDACDNMRDNKFVPHVKSFVKALPLAADAYIDVMRPLAKMWAVDDYGNNNAFNQDQAAFKQGCLNSLMTGFPFQTPNPAKQLPSPTAWEYTCTQAAPKFSSMLEHERSVIELQLIKIAAAGCHLPTGWNPKQGIHYTCGTSAAYQACLNALSAGKKKHCELEPLKVNKNPDAEIGHTKILGAPASSKTGTTQTAHSSLPATIQRTPVTSRPLPDLIVLNTAALIGGHNVRKVVKRDGTTDVEGSEAAVASGGVCRFALHYELRNDGTIATGAFQSELTVSGGTPIVRTHGALAPNARTSTEVMMTLRPGNNPVTLIVDKANQVTESSESNNTFHTLIRVNGNCGGSAPAAGAAQRGRLQLPGR